MRCVIHWSGPLSVILQTLSNGPGPGVVVATTEAGSPSRAALALLTQATSEAAKRLGLGVAQKRSHADKD